MFGLGKILLYTFDILDQSLETIAWVTNLVQGEDERFLHMDVVETVPLLVVMS